MELGRRRFALAAGTLGASALAGCSSLTGGNGGPETVTATAPNDDGTGSVSELRYLIEHTQDSIQGDFAIPLTAMETGSGDGYTYVKAVYESTATDLDEFVEEVSVFARSYAIYVGAGGDAVTDFTVDVDDRYDGQPKSFGIRREWARRYNSGEKNGNWYINRIAATFAYPTTTGTENESGTNSSSSGNKL